MAMKLPRYEQKAARAAVAATIRWVRRYKMLSVADVAQIMGITEKQQARFEKSGNVSFLYVSYFSQMVAGHKTANEWVTLMMSMDQFAKVTK